MIRFIRHFFGKRFPKLHPSGLVAEMMTLGFDDLKEDFTRRTFGFDSYKRPLGRANLRLVNWIGSVDYCGYVRERCLKYLIANFQPGDENRILLRLGDWVPGIQDIARAWVREHLHELPFEAVHAQQKLILHLSRKENLRDDPIMSVIDRWLLDNTMAVDRSRFHSLSPTFRRHVYRLALRGNEKLGRWALQDRDPFNRLLALDMIGFENLSVPDMDRLRGDKAICVRRRYLQARIDGASDFLREELISFCMDKSRSIRRLAQFHLQRVYGIDAYDLYKQRTDETFYYIADFARRSDLDHFATALRSERREVRFLCLQAICRIDPSRLHQVGLERLLEENRRFRGLVHAQLSKICTVEQILELEDVLHRTSPSGVLIYLNLLSRKSHWHFVDAALSVLAKDPSKEEVDFIRSILRVKIAVYEKAPPVLEASIRRKLLSAESVQHLRVREMLREIDFSMRSE